VRRGKVIDSARSITGDKLALCLVELTQPVPERSQVVTDVVETTAPFEHQDRPAPGDRRLHATGHLQLMPLDIDFDKAGCNSNESSVLKFHFLSNQPRYLANSVLDTAVESV
jgi:hypothetical protein